MPSGIRSLDMQIIDKIFQMEGGYVLDFSDRTMTQFFAEEFNIDIDHPQYRDDGTSKAKHLRCFLRKEDTNTAVRALTRFGTIVRHAEHSLGKTNGCRTLIPPPQFAESPSRQAASAVCTAASCSPETRKAELCEIP